MEATIYLPPRLSLAEIVLRPNQPQRDVVFEEYLRRDERIMAHHNGPRKKTRYKLKKDIRKRGILPVTSLIQRFKLGQKVHVVCEPSVQKGMPHRRFHGKTGTVIGQRGRAWLLEVKDGNKGKIVIARSQHLKAQKQIDVLT
jgi:large subunit ribosomal protein L21e